ncbi:hypothetical protein Tco_0619431 [Tanacetum coccineum]
MFNGYSHLPVSPGLRISTVRYRRSVECIPPTSHSRQMCDTRTPARRELAHDGSDISPTLSCMETRIVKEARNNMEVNRARVNMLRARAHAKQPNRSSTVDLRYTITKTSSTPPLPTLVSCYPL